MATTIKAYELGDILQLRLTWSICAPVGRGRGRNRVVSTVEVRKVDVIATVMIVERQDAYLVVDGKISNAQERKDVSQINDDRIFFKFTEQIHGFHSTCNGNGNDVYAISMEDVAKAGASFDYEDQGKIIEHLTALMDVGDLILGKAGQDAEISRFKSCVEAYGYPKWKVEQFQRAAISRSSLWNTYNPAASHELRVTTNPKRK